MPELRVTLDPGDTNLSVVLPSEVVERFGAGKRPPVLVRINGVDYHTRVSVYGGRYLIGFRKDIAAAAGLTPGASVDIAVELDTTPRALAVPDDFAALLAADPDAASRFEALSFTNRKEYVTWLESAKRAETRQRRLSEVLPMLKSGRRTPLG